MLVPLPSPADEIVAAFQDELEAVLPGFAVGIYLSGSIALDDFHPEKSDIDFLVFYALGPDEVTIGKLRAIHRHMESRYPANKLNGSYLAYASLSFSAPETIQVICYEKSLTACPFAMAPVALTELKNNGVTIKGEPAASLPISIDRAQLDTFILKNVQAYWKPWLQQNSSFFSRKVLLVLFPRFTEWAILGVARQLYTLRTGKWINHNKMPPPDLLTKCLVLK